MYDGFVKSRFVYFVSILGTLELFSLNTEMRINILNQAAFF